MAYNSENPAPVGLVDAVQIVKKILKVVDEDADNCGVAKPGWPDHVPIASILPSGNQPDLCTLGELRALDAALSAQAGAPAGRGSDGRRSAL